MVGPCYENSQVSHSKILLLIYSKDVCIFQKKESLRQEVLKKWDQWNGT